MINKISFLHQKSSNYYVSSFDRCQNIKKSIQNGLFVTPSVQNDKLLNTDKSNSKKMLYAGIALAGMALIGFIFRKNIKNFFQVKILQSQMKKYPADIQYRARMLSDMGLNPKDAYKLRSVMGAQEFTSVTRELSTNSKFYIPGRRVFDSIGEPHFVSRENVDSCLYRANLHMHTVNSDGKITIPELLSQAVEYADKLAKKIKKPFVVAITDHDSVQGCKDAVDIIMKNPWKYRNLRLVLGIENTAIYTNNNLLKNPGRIHLLSYCINPFGKDIDKFLIARIDGNVNNITKALNGANREFGQLLGEKHFSFNFEEMAKIVPSAKVSVKYANSYLKDYLQFRTVYSDVVENNPALNKFLADNGVSLGKIDFSAPVGLIPAKVDCSSKKYWEYYQDALVKSVVSAVKKEKPSIDEFKLVRCLNNVQDKTKEALNKMEWMCFDSKSPLFIANPQMPSFSNMVEQLANIKDGVMGMAHPGVVFPIGSVKSDEKMLEMYKDLYDIMATKGRSKACFAEDFYQSYFSSTPKILAEELPKLSQEHGFIKTGGLDTHAAEIFQAK